MKLWIPGANGLVGKALLKETDAIGTGHLDVDISDRSAVWSFVQRNEITHIINCAAYSLVDLSETHRKEAFMANAVGPENLAWAAKKAGAQSVHISTDYVFAGDGKAPLKETDPVGPLSYYGLTKLEGEQRVLEMLPSATIVRTSWVFGEGGKNFVAKMMQLLREQKEIRLTCDQWGRPTYAPDLAKVLLQMFGRPGIYHFANAGVATKYTFGLAMKEEALRLGIPADAQLIAAAGSSFPSPCKRPVYSAFDTAKIEQALQSKPRPWQTTLREFMEDYAACPSPR